MSIEQAFDKLEETNSIKEAIPIIYFLIQEYDNTEKVPSNWKHSENAYISMLNGYSYITGVSFVN